MDVRDTDTVLFDKDLRVRLDESLIAMGACLVVSSPHVRSLPVRVKGWRYLPRSHRSYMSIVRIAWRFANPTGHLTSTDFAVHTCENTGQDGRPLCASGAHLRKGTKEDIERARVLRAKGFFDRMAA